jgi:hypothetical protein
MNFRILALGALALTAIVPATIATPAFANSNAHACIFQPNSDRDGTWCNPFNAKSADQQDYGLKVVTTKKSVPVDYTTLDTRGSSMQR